MVLFSIDELARIHTNILNNINVVTIYNIVTFASLEVKRKLTTFTFHTLAKNKIKIKPK